MFSTNVLPAFSGEFDGGTVRGCCRSTYSRRAGGLDAIPTCLTASCPKKPTCSCDFRSKVRAGSSATRDFTVPASSRELLARWVLSADPVRAWAAVRLAVTAEENMISVTVLFADFRNWAEAQGLKAESLRSVIAFGKRLRSAAPGLEYHRSDGSAYPNARICAR